MDIAANTLPAYAPFAADLCQGVAKVLRINTFGSSPFLVAVRERDSDLRQEIYETNADTWVILVRTDLSVANSKIGLNSGSL
jgi:hypothetical protein